ADALKDLSSVTERLKNDLKELGKNPALRTLEKAAREANRSAGGSSEMQKQIESMQKTLGEKGQDPQALEKLKSELQKAQKSAGALPGKDTPGGAAARQEMAQTLSDLARQ